MQTTIKDDFHQLINRINDETLLSAFYQLLEKRATQPAGELWNSLTDEEQKELLLSNEESKDSANLLDYEIVKKKHDNRRNPNKKSY